MPAYNAYQPMLGPLPGKQWIPPNSDVGYGFIGSTCAHCARDRAIREGVEIEECDDDELCEIVGASFRGEAVEWRRMPDGSVHCLAFVPAGEVPPPPPCMFTLDLFADQATG
ncbi:MAG: hypothetical protein ACK40L_06875 [Hydrogenophaga sp.]